PGILTLANFKSRTLQNFGLDSKNFTSRSWFLKKHLSLKNQVDPILRQAASGITNKKMLWDNVDHNYVVININEQQILECWEDRQKLPLLRSLRKK
ncbi:MAG: hypothetical protein JWM09_91, partial [Francisellaceae bacterium]|nr:hypothetical protein [Francisellaceae bacterium]